MTRIKICGITNLADGRDAAGLGAHFLGFVLCRQSKRYVAYPTVKKIVAGLPSFVETVAVFVDEELALVEKIVTNCRIGFVQLHGHESAEYCQRLRDKKIKVIKALSLNSEDDLLKVESYRQSADYLLIDSPEENGLGGSGHLANWELAVRAREIFGDIFLAGGLTAENVRSAIEKVHPFAVDVASGVERIPGKKDYQKLLNFIQQVQRYG